MVPSADRVKKMSSFTVFKDSPGSRVAPPVHVPVQQGGPEHIVATHGVVAIAAEEQGDTIAVDERSILVVRRVHHGTQVQGQAPTSVGQLTDAIDVPSSVTSGPSLEVISFLQEQCWRLGS